MGAFRPWTGEASDYNELLDKVEATGRYEVEGRTFQYPTRDDYERALRDAGALAEGTPLGDPDLLAAVQAHWHAGGHNACVFAADLSDHRAESGWETYVLAGDIDNPSGAADAMDELCRSRIASPEVEVVSLLFPALDDAETLSQLLSRLGALAHWNVRERGVEDVPEVGKVVLIGVRAKVELDHWAEVLGFGRFAGQGNTRLAPSTELAVRAKEPQRPRRTQRAYMADIEMDLDNREFGQWWHDTERQRAERLGAAQDARAKARVTFALAQDAWERRTG